MKTVLSKDLYKNVYSNFIHNCLKMETPKCRNGYTNCGVFIEQNTNKQTKQNKIDYNTDNSVDEFQKHVVQKKPGPKKLPIV